MKCCCFFTCYSLRLRWMSQVWLDVLLLFDFLISERVFLNVLFVCWMFSFFLIFYYFLYLCLLLVCLHVFESLWFVLLLVNAFMFADVFELRELCGVSWIALHRKCHKHSLDLGENQIVPALLSRKIYRFLWFEAARPFLTASAYDFIAKTCRFSTLKPQPCGHSSLHHPILYGLKQKRSKRGN